MDVNRGSERETVTVGMMMTKRDKVNWASRIVTAFLTKPPREGVIFRTERPSETIGLT